MPSMTFLSKETLNFSPVKTHGNEHYTVVKCQPATGANYFISLGLFSHL